jgi:Na+/proline symporter
VPGAPGTLGAGFPPGPPPGYGQPGYGPPAPYGQGPGYAPSPYARPQQTNTSAIALTVVSGLSTLVGCFFAIPALVLGIMALVKQGESPADSAKFARWGWIAYAIAVAFVVIGGIIAIAVVASTSSTGY